MDREKLALCGVSMVLAAAIVAGCSSQSTSQPPVASAVAVFEGARLIAHPLQIRCPCAMLLEPLLVFGCVTPFTLGTEFSPECFRQPC